MLQRVVEIVRQTQPIVILELLRSAFEFRVSNPQSSCLLTSPRYSYPSFVIFSLIEVFCVSPLFSPTVLFLVVSFLPLVYGYSVFAGSARSSFFISFFSRNEQVCLRLGAVWQHSTKAFFLHFCQLSSTLLAFSVLYFPFGFFAPCAFPGPGIQCSLRNSLFPFLHFALFLSHSKSFLFLLILSRHSHFPLFYDLPFRFVCSFCSMRRLLFIFNTSDFPLCSSLNFLPTQHPAMIPLHFGFLFPSPIVLFRFARVLIQFLLHEVPCIKVFSFLPNSLHQPASFFLSHVIYFFFFRWMFPQSELQTSFQMRNSIVHRIERKLRQVSLAKSASISRGFT